MRMVDHNNQRIGLQPTVQVEFIIHRRTTLAFTSKAKHVAMLLQLCLLGAMWLQSSAFTPLSRHSRRCHLTIGSPNNSYASTRLQLSQSQSVDVTGLQDHFGRWRLLQGLLEGDVSVASVQPVVYQILEYYLEQPETPGLPEKTSTRIQAVQSVLDNKTDWTGDMSSLWTELESILPNPDDDADEDKSTWDTIMELYGREAIKLEFQNGGMDWKLRACVVRVLIFYDFLTSGMPVQEKKS
jgi:hypothetical protein